MTWILFGGRGSSRYLKNYFTVFSSDGSIADLKEKGGGVRLINTISSTTMTFGRMPIHAQVTRCLSACCTLIMYTV